MLLFQRIIPEAVLPSRGTAHSAGLDLSAAWEGGPETIRVLPGSRALIGTGLKVAIPYGYYGQIHPRSGLAVKGGIDVLAGVLDADYRGEIKIVLYNSDQSQTFFVNKGMKIAQLLVKPCLMREAEEVASLPDGGTRGAAGFGSTGV